MNNAGGGGGGAIRLKASGKIEVASLIRSSGGGGTGGSAGGAGGAIHIEAPEVFLRPGSTLDVIGRSRRRQEVIGLISSWHRSGRKSSKNYLADGFKNVSRGDGSGSIPGTVGTSCSSAIFCQELNWILGPGELIVDTEAAKITHSSGKFGYGIIEDRYYRDEKVPFGPILFVGLL